MKKTLILGSVSIAAAALLVGCGSSSSSDDNTEALTGYFIDAAVKGVDYKTTSGLNGTTDRFGRFQYKNGDKVKLYIGNLLLGEVTPTEEGLVTPATLTNSDEKEVLLLRTLQSLDADGNVSNGITIPQSVVDGLKDINETSIADHNESSLIDVIDHGDKHALDSNYDGEIDVKESDAKDHAQNSERDWNEGKRPDRGHEDEPVKEANDSSHGNGNGQGGQGNGHSEENNSTEESHGDGFDLSKYPVSTLTPELKNSLAYMGNEERLAYDIYQNLYTYHVTESAEEIKQLKNISEKSEIKHIGIVQDLVKRYALNPEDVSNVVNPVADRDVAFEDMPSGEYDVPAIQELYNTLYAKGIVSKTEALMVGCMVEVTDVEDLDKYVTLAEASNATDVVEAFNVLRDGSYNHYWAFDKGLKKAGVSNGCYVEGDALLTNKESVYPSNEHGSKEEAEASSEESHGNGQGRGNGRGKN
jgi:hypothetical protein